MASRHQNHRQNKRLRTLLGMISLVAATTDTVAPPAALAFSPSLPITTRTAPSKSLLQSPSPSPSTMSSTASSATITDTISTPTSLMEEEMLSGSEQSVLLEMEESKRRKIWKQLDKASRQASKSKAKSSGAGGFGGGGGGFGGGGGASKKKGGKKQKATPKAVGDDDGQHSAFDPSKDKSRFGAQIVEQGVARINNRLSKETAASLLEFVNGYLEEALTTKVEDMTLEEIYKQQPYFADVREKLNRWDMLLPLEESEMVQQALYELLVQDPVLSDSIESILGSSAQLYELGSLISDPGSERQLLHADYNYQPDFQPKIPPALTCFVALQDITESMGPTTFLPSSATEEYHQEIAVGQEYQYQYEYVDGNGNGSGSGETGSPLLSSSTNHLATLGTGDCALYNPMTLHCGGANRSEQRRVIFYFSFKNKKYDEKDWPLAYASLRPDLRARGLTLTDLQEIVSERSKN